MPRKCHLCAADSHSVANCPRLAEIYASHNNNDPEQQQRQTSPNGNDDDSNHQQKQKHQELSIYHSSSTKQIAEMFQRRNGLQHIMPYYHIFSVPVKGRWEGKRLSEALRSEFAVYPESYFEPACKDGRLKVVWDLFHLRKAEKTLKGRLIQMKQQQQARELKAAENDRRRRQREEEEEEEETEEGGDRKEEQGREVNDDKEDIIKHEEKPPLTTDDIVLQPASHPDTILKIGMIILHRVHRHEHPVLESVCPIEVVDFVPVPKQQLRQEEQEQKNSVSVRNNNNQHRPSSLENNNSSSVINIRGIIAINKPPSIPVHSCGRYHFNTVQHMLRCGFWKFKKSEENRIADRILSSSSVTTKTNMEQQQQDSSSSFAAFKNQNDKISAATKILQEQIFGDPKDAETSGLHSCHRLDRGTSGVLLFATCTDVSKLVVASLREKSEEPDLLLATTAQSSHQDQNIINASSTSSSSSSSSSPIFLNPDKMSKVYIARVHGRVVPPPDAKILKDDSSNDNNNDFFYLQRSIFCSGAQEGRFSCLTAEQEIEALAVRKQEMQEQLKTDQDLKERRQQISDQQKKNNNDVDGGRQSANANKLATLAEIQKLRAEKQARQAELCKGRNARGAVTNEQQRQQDDNNDNENDDTVDVESSSQKVMNNNNNNNNNNNVNTIAIRNSKWAATWFKVLSYDSKLNESVVECHPVTGRTHQLRVHLAIALNAPIIGDDVYGKKQFRGPAAANSESINLESDVKRLMISLNSSSESSGKYRDAALQQDASMVNNKNDDDDDDDDDNHQSYFDATPLQPGKDFTLEPTCPDCTYKQHQKDPHLDSGGSPVLALHALRYRLKIAIPNSSGIDEQVETDEPAWVKKM